MDTRLNIIVIEDNDDLREATVDALRIVGHQVAGLDCAEALPEQSGWQRIDLLIIDLNLPGEDGLALARRARRVQPDIGIIIVTARDLPSDKQQGYASGADIYMSKPVSLEELSAAIQSLGRRLKHHSEPVDALVPTLDTVRHQLRCGATEIDLAAAEVTLLAALTRAANARLETWQLVQLLAREKAKDPKAALEILLARLRSKLQQAGCEGLRINAIRNWGYQLIGPLKLL